MANIFLYINTAVDNLVELALIGKGGAIMAKSKKKTGLKESEKLLMQIVSLLEGHNFSFNKLSGIIVVRGPGRFTSLRIGIATANTLAFALKIPVVGIKLVENIQEIDFVKLIKSMKKRGYVVPMYGKEPNITKASRQKGK